MKRSLILLPVALAAALTLSACDSRDNQTAGQKVDQAVASTRAATEEARTAAANTANTVATSAADATITTKINAALAADDKLKATKINVDTKNGQVVLNGSAPDAGSRDRATTLAKAVDGVSAVDNRLAVVPGS